MDGAAGNTKKEMPKRARNPPRKMGFYETDPGSPRDDSDGKWVIILLYGLANLWRDCHFKFTLDTIITKFFDSLWSLITGIIIISVLATSSTNIDLQDFF